MLRHVKHVLTPQWVKIFDANRADITISAN